MILYFIFAYVGPGLGGGFIAAVAGVLISIFLALFAILWYPFKKLIQKFKKKEEE
jgi:cellobiose-specific phosphotransferase system component IIC